MRPSCVLPEMEDSPYDTASWPERIPTGTPARWCSLAGRGHEADSLEGQSGSVRKQDQGVTAQDVLRRRIQVVKGPCTAYRQRSVGFGGSASI